MVAQFNLKDLSFKKGTWNYRDIVPVIFGGAGFIGTHHFAKHLIDDEAYEKVYLFDQGRFQ